MVAFNAKDFVEALRRFNLAVVTPALFLRTLERPMVDPKVVMIPGALRDALAAEAANEGVSLEDMTVQAVEAHLEAIRTRKFFEERRRRADPAWVLRFLDREGGLPPEPGDELPEGYTPISERG